MGGPTGSPTHPGTSSPAKPSHFDVKAAVLTKLNAPLELWDVEPDQPLHYGQVLVDMICSGICGAQLQEIRGEKGNAGYLPHLLGHEGCGVVVQVGQGVSRVHRGQKVCLHWRKAAGIESCVPSYAGPLGQVGSGRLATLARQCIASENRMTPVPDDTPPELAALLGCGLSTALGTVEREASVRMGESVLIVGCGGLGANLIRACRIAGAARIGCCDVHQTKQAVAKELGATEWVVSSDGDPFDVVIETSGAAGAISKSMKLLGPSGRFIQIGHLPESEPVTFENFDDMFEGEGKTIKATQGGGFQPHRDIPRYIAAWRAGVLKVDGIVTHHLALEHVNEGIELVKSGEASRVMIHMAKKP